MERARRWGRTARAGVSALVLACGVVACAGPERAGEPVPLEQEQEPVWPPEERVVDVDDWSAGETAEQAHGWVSQRVVDSAEWLDGFLGNPQSEEEVNRTRVRLRQDTVWQEGGELEFDVKAQLRLRLPRTSERLQLFFDGGDEEGSGIDDDPLDPTERELLEPESRTSSAGAEYFLLDELKRNAKLIAGMRFRDGEPTPRVGGRYRQTVELDSVLLRFTERVIFEEELGGESLTRMDVDRVLAEDLFFRATTELSWFEYQEGLYLRQAFLLSDRVSRDSTLTWTWINDFRSEPHGQLEVVRLRFGWRHALWRRYTFLELAPEVSFDRESDFEPAFALLLRFDVYFGADE